MNRLKNNTDKIAIMQPYFFPYIGYFQLINYVDTFLLYGNLPFRKRSWITRNRLLDSFTKKPYYINCPVKQKSSNKLIKDMEIANDIDWQKNIEKKIYLDYHKKPFYKENSSLIFKTLEYKETNMIKFHYYCIKEICKYLKIETKIILDDNKFLDLEKETLSKTNPKIARIISICNEFKTNNYINPENGKSIYSKPELKTKGINLNFLYSNAGTYNQGIKEPVERLSIIDVLLNIGQKKTIELLSKYEIK